MVPRARTRAPTATCGNVPTIASDLATARDDHLDDAEAGLAILERDPFDLAFDRDFRRLRHGADPSRQNASGATVALEESIRSRR